MFKKNLTHAENIINKTTASKYNADLNYGTVLLFSFTGIIFSENRKIKTPYKIFTAGT